MGVASSASRAQRPRTVNIHHVELFYYVARHGGISRAVRNMPYGIQQPAVSSQILSLEDDLGAKLFERNPFKLTPAGEALYEFARPFFDNLEATAERLRQTAAPSLRIGASELVLRDYLPTVIAQVRAREPKLRLGLRSGLQQNVETWLLEREIDMAIVPLQKKPTAKLRYERLLQLPLVLLVHRDSEIQSPDELWRQDVIEEPLICLPETEAITRVFREGLRLRKVDWPHTVESSSVSLITRYVANGYGVGVNVAAPQAITHPDVRVLPLGDFGQIEIAVLTNGKPSPLVQQVIAASQQVVSEEWPESQQVR